MNHRAELFRRNLELVGGNIHPAESATEASRILHQLHITAGGGEVVRWDTSLAESLFPRAAPIRRELPPERGRELCLSAEMGITETDYALADSGTLVLESGPAKSRMVSLLPPMHVALLPESRIIESFAQFIAQFVAAGGPERMKQISALTFITGPSRTADIEQTLTIGVHGPQSLHVVILCGQ